MLNNKYKYDNKPALRLTPTQLEAKKRIENKILTKVYTFQDVNCPVCEACNYELLSQKDRYGLPVTTVICKTCGLLISNPMMTQDSLNKYYADDNDELYRDSKYVTLSYFNKRYNHGKKIIEFIKKHIGISMKDKFVIEVGCGAGGILAAFKDEGAEVFGIDLGNNYLDFGKEKYNLNLMNMSLADYINNNEGGRFDFIIYSHVLEHIRLLQDELQLIKELCHEKTLIYIEVPGLLSVHKNYGDFLHYLQNAHLYHFSLGTLLNLFQKYGFSLIYGDELIQSLFTTSNQCLTHRNYYNTNISYLKKMEKINKFIPVFRIKKMFRKILINMLKKIHLYKIIKKVYHRIF